MLVKDVIAKLKPEIRCDRLVAPRYRANGSSNRVMLAVETYKRHMTSEGWQLQIGLEHGGYALWGKYLANDEADVPTILDKSKPGTVIVQDVRDWWPELDSAYDTSAAFTGIERLAIRNDIFKLVMLKDAHGVPGLQRELHEAIGAHAWIVYYHPDIIAHISPWVRREHLVRTYHSLDPAEVPVFNKDRRDCVLSGAANPRWYPLRSRLIKAKLPGTAVIQHPGYGAKGTATPKYLQMLNQYKISIATASNLGYALRKIIESTACGCLVITDLPADDVMPEIDGNLLRVDPNITIPQLASLIHRSVAQYDIDRQKHFAAKAIKFYDYHNVYARLAGDVQRMQDSYSGTARANSRTIAKAAWKSRKP